MRLKGEKGELVDTLFVLALTRTSHGIVGEMLIFKFSFGTRTIVVYVRLHLTLKYWCCTEERLNSHKVSV